MKDCNHNRIHEIEDSLYKNQDDRIYEIWDKIDERKMLRKKALKKKPTTNTKMKVNQNNLVVMKKNLIVARTNRSWQMKKDEESGTEADDSSSRDTISIIIQLCFSDYILFILLIRFLINSCY
jgi:hypothetical protein